MNQSKIYITLALGSMLTFGSCSKDKLNPVTTTDLSDAVVYDTPQRIANQVNGLYGALKSGKMLGGRYLIYNDVRGRNFLNERGNAVTALTVWNFSIAGTDAAVNDLWSAGYSTINKVNIFLDGMSSKGNAVVGDELGKQYGGEAKYVRAVSYYTLLQLFCKPYTADNGSSLGLPLRLTPIIGNGFSDLARSSVAEIYTQILKDLDEAEAELPSSYGTAAANVTHAHKNTAIAMKVRVYQSMGQYDKVITEANKIVSASVPFTATSGVAFALVSDIKTVFSSYNTAESIFSSPFTGGKRSSWWTESAGILLFTHNGTL